ncbi:Translation initiation factor 2 [Desulfovibrio sp. TomC]|nr:Translation initiation factor 2 [Desulfovibrio sp. TomC]
MLPVCLLLVSLAATGPGVLLAATQPALTLETCGALLRETGLGDGWPGGNAVRPGQAALPGDKGLGCRFLLTGDGGGSVVEARLARPLPGGGTAVDRWFVPVRRGEAASAVYLFAPGLPISPGDWTLTLAAEGLTAVEARFQVAGSEPPAMVPTAIAARPVGPQALSAAPVPPAPASLPPASGDAGPPPISVLDAGAALRLAPAPEAAPAWTPPPQAAPAPAADPAPTATPAAAPSEGAVPPRPGIAAAPLVPTAGPGPAAGAPKAGAAAKDKPQPPATQVKETAKPAAATGYMALQTGLFADADNARVQAVKLRARGMPACVAVSGEGAKRRYRVLAGRFGDRRAAAEARGGVKAILGLTPILYTVDAAEVSRLRCR